MLYKHNAKLDTYYLNVSVKTCSLKRQQGYGSLTLKLGIEKAKEMEIKKLYLVCDNDNTPSKKILENAGCSFEGEVLRAKPNGKDRLEYSLELI